MAVILMWKTVTRVFFLYLYLYDYEYAMARKYFDGEISIVIF